MFSRIRQYLGAFFNYVLGKTARLIGFVARFLWRETWRNIGIIIGYGIVGVLGLALTLFMLWPSYKDPSSRMYTSGMGYGAFKRKLGMPFEVSGAHCVRRDVVIPYLGEGLITGAPTRLAMIPMAMIKKVYVEEGDTVTRGQLLLELDDLEAQRKLASARTAYNTAKAELERVMIGSTYVLAQERPEHDRIKVDEARKQVAFIEQELRDAKDMVERGLIAKSKVIEVEQRLVHASSQLKEALYFAGMSEKGVTYSQQIAKNALEDAAEAVRFREAELKTFKLYAPTDGMVSAVLVREGEYNSDTGKPAFLLTTGMWFEGYFDQAVLSRIQLGQQAEVILEAHPGEVFSAKVAKIIPEVTFASGGPEIARPLRPRGTGAPEWAATFRVRFEFVDGQTNLIRSGDLALGMTGNVKLLTETRALTVPRNAVLSVAASRALVTQPETAELNASSTNWSMKPVKLGYVGHDWVEIAEGLSEGEVVLTKGHRIIREGDAIQLVELGD